MSDTRFQATQHWQHPDWTVYDTGTDSYRLRGLNEVEAIEQAERLNAGPFELPGKPTCGAPQREVSVTRGQAQSGLPVDERHPDYRRGARAACTLIDISAGIDVRHYLDLAEGHAFEAGGDESRYLKVRGYLDTLREYLTERSDI